MGREKDSFLWDQFELSNGASKCKHCEATFKGKPSVTRLRKHLQGVKDGGIRICTKVPDSVKKALADGSNKRRRIELGSSSNDRSNSISTAAPQQNDASENPVQDDRIFEGLKDIMELDLFDELREKLDTHVLGHANEAVVYGSKNRPQLEPSTSNNEATNLALAPQQNSGFENPLHIEESIQDPMVQGKEQDNLGGHDRDDGVRYETREDTLLRTIDQLQRKFDELRLCLMEGETMEDDVPEADNGIPFPTVDLVGKAFEENLDIVWAWLMSSKISSIGIYGMGGVGKTTLVTHIHNRILNSPGIVDHVYWVTVSQAFSIERMQNLIAKIIGMKFRNEDDVKKKAAKLSKELRRKCKFVLILDDVWNHFDVKKIGIPTEVNGCKLVITTRSLEVCRRTNCQEKLKVEPLLENEAWKLFLETLGHDLAPGIEQIARRIARECDGLPLGIVTMAGSMREVNDVHEWNNALTELQNSEVRQDDMEPDVFRILRFSYARLNDPMLQQCLLYCALYPEDFEIERDELIEHLIVERIIETTDSRKASYDKGQTMLNKLVNVCLLEHTDDNGHIGVKMHDLIRDMTIQIMKECSPSLVEAGKQLTCLPKEKWWTEDTVRVSVMNNCIKEISSHYYLRCPNLSTLLLSRNRELKWITELFFYQLRGLKVLNLSCTRIEELPKSVSYLENLTALFLRRCDSLRYVPSLKKLGALEVLDLYNCIKVEEVPEGLESLSNLKYLNLLFTGITTLYAGILRNLSLLQFLAFHNSSEIGVKGEEVGCLCNMEKLYWNFYDQGGLNNYISSLSSMQTQRQQLSQYFLLVCPGLTNDEMFRERFDYGYEWGRDLHLLSSIMSREVLLPEDIQKLAIYLISVEDGRSLCLKNAVDLKEFTIEGCKEIEYLFCLNSSPSIFQTLETIEIFEMEKLRGLFTREGDDGVRVQFPSIGTFSHLKEFRIQKCHSMKKLFPCGLLSNLQNLQELYVSHCSEMEDIIGSEEEEEEGSNTNYHSIFTGTHFALQSLRCLTLDRLQKLKSICNAKLMCNSLQKICVFECPELTKMPFAFPLSSLQTMEGCPEIWWDSVE